MTDRRWVAITDIAGPIGFTMSIFSNSVLLSLIFSSSSPIKGAYKNMLIVLCIFTMFYSFVEIMLQPLIHIYDDTLFLIHRKRFDLSKGITRLIPTTYCWCYAMSFSLFALQFLYRYVAVCKPHLVVFFTGCYFYYWLALILSLATSWGLTAAFMFPQTNRTTESFNYVIKTSYDLDPYWTDYVAYKYFDTDENHVRWVNVLSLFGVLQHGLVITLSFGTLFYCGIKTYLSITEHVGMSSKTRSLQLQLFRALVAQTCLPMLMMYMPIGFMFSCPYFDLQLGAVTNYQTVMAQLYPGIDPFMLLFLINAYRKTVLSLICPNFIQKKYVQTATTRDGTDASATMNSVKSTQL
ncbi:Serpentine receptor class r-10 [Caenorhabditis elegans]|uniref:Serpentine receptor class r-10 n=1 Tax=Caenorhabditis elegans TaxID=6239 RepID=Q19145_CAEEL|nr:Seven TM Receptor [Caenorhabditis elegans]CAB01141.2 Seven TM Receptor [Caenorhabditis elegans]|eukprot:NP_505860.2 Seven TM Receptor [Caenorhabditis elegans]